jgi:hypothetical protein
MIRSGSSPNFGSLRAFRVLFRPSAILRAAWLGVLLLHVWLVGRRIVAGEWTTAPDLLRGFFCVVGVGYASLKFWQISTVFDDRPRRMLAFLLLLAFGHWAMLAPDGRLPLPTDSQSIRAVVVLPSVVGLLALAIGLGLLAGRRRVAVVVASRIGCAGDRRPPASQPDSLRLFQIFTAHLFQRPPPYPA